MDNVAVTIAERMHYQGLVDIDLDKQLGQLKERRLEQDLKDKLDDEVMQEYLNENGLLDDQDDKKEENRQHNWDMFQALSEFQALNDGFLHIKKQIDKNRKIVKNITHKRKHLLYDHYKTLEQRYMEDQEKQSIIEEYKEKDPEKYQSRHNL